MANELCLVTQVLVVGFIYQELARLPAKREYDQAKQTPQHHGPTTKRPRNVAKGNVIMRRSERCTRRLGAMVLLDIDVINGT